MARFGYVGSTRSDSLVFRTEPGATYGLFALASDRVGNAEPLRTEAELTFVAGVVASEETASGPTMLELAAPYPNPTRGDMVVQVGVPSAGPVRVFVLDARGREVAVLAARAYLIRAETAERQVTQCVTVAC